MINVVARHAVPLQVMWTVSPNSVLWELRICRGFVPVSLVSRFHGNDNRGYYILIMMNVWVWEWQSGLWFVNNDKRRGTSRRAPTNDVNGIPNSVLWVLRICRGFEPVSLDSRLHGNDNLGYDLLIMINVGARSAVPLQVMWTVAPNSVSGILLDKEISCYH
jgi:hypothetical protein